jgi:hypothetical protein
MSSSIFRGDPPTLATPSTPAVVETQAGARPTISWAAIVAGVVVVIAVQLLLGLLGAGIGLGMVHPGEGSTPAVADITTGAGIWWLISIVISFLLAGWATARLAHGPYHVDGALHGLVVWSVTTLITFFLLTTAIGGFVGGAFSMLGGVADLAGQGIKAAAPQAQIGGTTPEAIQQQAQSYLQPANPDPATMSPADAQKEIARTLPDLTFGGDRAAPAKDRIITIMAAQLKISKDEATQRFNQTQADLDQKRQQAERSAGQATKAGARLASSASYLAFAALLIGAFAATLGGAIAAPRQIAG